jgi:capsule polysaccharide modification protein KpsS
VQPELTVEEMAFDYQDQVNTLRNILAALPADMYLVVKEHSPMLGYRPLAVYSELVHMPGIIIADTQEDSHKLIAQASVVITLTGTVALEAVLYRIPAIVLGSIYFDSFNGIYKPGNLDELKKLLSNPEKLPGATEEDALRALGSLLRASEPGKPARVDVVLQEIDHESAKVMMSELESLAKDS